MTRRRNGSRAGKVQVEVPASKMGSALAECLKQEGFILNWRKIEEGNPQGLLRFYLKYTKARKPILRQIKRVSRPGLRIYASKDKLPKIYSGIGITILTTPKGILTDAQARAQGVGGEVICHVW